VRVCDVFKPQEVKSTMWALAEIQCKLGEAQEPLVRAVLTVSGDMNAQEEADMMVASLTCKHAIEA
jgi:hypothetical protein